MTGLTDPALRALHCQGCSGSISSMGGLDVYDCDGLAAAEAAPLDVDVAAAYNFGREDQRAATETCPDCGLTAERIGQMHITAQRLRSPDTETDR